MTVLIRKKVKFGNSEMEIKSYEPAGVHTKEERLQAEQLDKYLSQQIPEIAKIIEQKAPLESNNSVRRWYLLGCELRKIVDNQVLVSRVDVKNMLIWQVIDYFLPQTLKPSGSEDDKPYSEKQHKNQDHLTLCYEIGKYKWHEVKWIKRWSDWHQICHRPGIIRDKRILVSLGNAIETLDNYPAFNEIIEIVKLLGKAFPTRKFRDSSQFSEEEISHEVDKAVKNVIAKREQ